MKLSETQLKILKMMQWFQDSKGKRGSSLRINFNNATFFLMDAITGKTTRAHTSTVNSLIERSLITESKVAEHYYILTDAGRDALAKG